MSEYRIVKPEKGVVGIMKGEKHIGYVESSSASMDVLNVIINLQTQLAKAEDIMWRYLKNKTEMNEIEMREYFKDKLDKD